MPKSLSNIFNAEKILDSKSTKFLTKALENNNLQGFDYLEFKQSLGALAKMSIEEGMAMKSAFTTASTMGLTKQKLIETAGYYKQVLAKEKEQFDIALQNQMQQRVNNKKEEVRHLTTQIQQFRDQIKRLEEQIAHSQRKIDENNESINKAASKIEVTRANFEQCFKAFIAEIDKDIEKVNEHL